MSLKCFSPTYESARDRFSKSATDAGARLDQIELDVSGPNEENLTINMAWLGAERPERVLLHTSGLHGVEGFAGSAIQIQLLQQPPPLSDRDALVLVHGINPYGMAWLRRVNEANVDLNRNFPAPADPFEGAPDGDPKLNALLNPESPPQRFDLFYLRLGWCILRYGLNELTQAVAGGQYRYPMGLFFGGHKFEEGPVLLLDWLKSHCESAERIGVIDVHTGLGKYGVDSLLVSHGPDTEIFKRLQSQLGNRIETLDPRGVAFRVRGLFVDALERELPHVWACMIQEFGTFNVFRMLKALREENRWHHYGQKEQLDHSAKQQLLQVFCPDDDRWRREILTRGRELVNEVAAMVFAR